MSDIEQALDLYSAGQYDEALEILIQAKNSTEQCPHALVTKGRLILISEQPRELQISDAEAAFKRALEIDPKCIAALLELGWLYFAVYDDVAQARLFFEEALGVTQGDMLEAMEGIAECMQQSIGDREQVRQSLKEISGRIIGDNEVEAVMQKLS